MRIRSVWPFLAAISTFACTSSPATLASPPEFERIVAQGMELAAPESLVKTPVVAPFPTRQIVWHVNPVPTRGVVRLVANGFDGPDASVYKQQVLDNSARTDVLNVRYRIDEELISWRRWPIGFTSAGLERIQPDWIGFASMGFASA